MLDVYKIRDDFPILQKEVNGHQLVYFDNAATTQKPKQVIEAIKWFYENINANPLRSVHYLAEKATEAYEKSREKIAKFIGAEKDEIIFVRNATEAINLVSFALPFSKNDTIVTTYLEHHSNLLPWLRLQKYGVKVKILGIKEDLDLDYEELEKIENPKLIAVTHQSNVTATITDVKRIAKIAKEKGALLLLDGAQSVPHMKVNVKDLGVDFLAFSGHKMLGPFGIGVLYIKKSVFNKLNPFLEGGEMIKDVRLNHIEFADFPFFFEAGTQNIEGAFALGVAIDYLNNIGMENIEKYEKELTKYLYDKIKDVEKIKIYSGKSKEFGPLLSFNLPKIHPHDLAYLLDQKGIAVRSGFHCAQPLIEDKLKANGTARASLYFYNTKEEIDYFVNTLKEISKKYE